MSLGRSLIGACAHSQPPVLPSPSILKKRIRVFFSPFSCSEPCILHGLPRENNKRRTDGRTNGGRGIESLSLSAQLNLKEREIAESFSPRVALCGAVPRPPSLPLHELLGLPPSLLEGRPRPWRGEGNFLAASSSRGGSHALSLSFPLFPAV